MKADWDFTTLHLSRLCPR